MPTPLLNDVLSAAPWHGDNRVEGKPKTPPLAPCNATPRPCPLQQQRRRSLGRQQRSPSNRTRGTGTCDKELLRQKCLELQKVEEENKRFQAELDEAERWGEEMIRSSEEKERQWAQERARLSQVCLDERKSSAVTELEEALATAKEQVRQETIKAAAFQESLAAAREALARKAREKNAAEAAAAKATEVAAAKQEALEAALAEQEVASKQAAEQARHETEHSVQAALEAEKNAAATATRRANELQRLLEAEEKAKQTAVQEEKKALATATKRAQDLELSVQTEVQAALKEEKKALATATKRAQDLELSLQAEVQARQVVEKEVEAANAMAAEAKAVAEDLANKAEQSEQIRESKDADRSLVASLRSEAEKAKAQAEKERTRCAEAHAAWKSALAAQEQLKYDLSSANAHAEKAQSCALRAEEQLRSDLQAAKAEAEKAHSSVAAAKAAAISAERNAEEARKELDQQRQVAAKQCQALEEEIKSLRDELRKRKRQNPAKVEDEFSTRQIFSGKYVFAGFILMVIVVGITFCLGQSPSVQSEVRTNFDVKVRISDSSETRLEDASEHYHEGVAAMKTGDAVKASRHANRAFKLDPKPEHAILLAKVFADKGLRADALRVLNRALSVDAGKQQKPLSEAHCAMLNNAGILLSEMENADHAVEHLRKAVSCADGRDFVHGMRLNLASAEMQRGQWDTCAEQARMVAAQNAKQVGAAMQQAAHVVRAVCLFRNGVSHDEIVTETRKAVQALPAKESVRSVCASLQAQSAREFAGKKVRAGKARNAVLPYEPVFWNMGQ